VTLTLRLRLALTTVVLFGLLVAGLSVVTYRILAAQVDADTAERLAAFADGLEGYLRFDGEGVSLQFDEQDDDEAAFVHEAARYLQVYDMATGRTLYESSALGPMGVDFTSTELAALRGAGGPHDISTPYGRVRFVTRDITHGGRPYVINAGISLSQADATLTRYRRLLLLRVPPAFLATVLAAWWLSAFALRPLSDMAVASADIDVGTLDRRLPLRGAGDELDRVALAFNATLERLQHAVGEMRQFSAALAHELRTPLAALRGEIELRLRDAATTTEQEVAYASQIEEIDRLAGLIDQILTLARAESGQIALTRVPVRLADLLRSVVELFEPVAEARGIALTAELDDAVVVEGDAPWLQRLAINLVDNALKFTPEGGRVTASVRRAGTEATLAVSDTGIGLSAEDAGRVFDRFFRADPSRTSSIEGAGLGLSLVQWIARQHHGRVSVDSRPGEGATFTVTLPLRTPRV